MKFKLLGLFYLLFLCTFSIFAQKADYKNPGLSVEKRVADLMSKMTLEEKVAQLQTSLSITDASKVPATGMGCLTEVFLALEPREAATKFNALQKAFIENTRLGIPVLYHGEAVFGLMATGTTCFPQPLGQAATFNIPLHTKIAEAIAKETYSWGHRQVLSPTVNVAYDPRWGRTHETYGEDPYLVGLMGVSYIKPMLEIGIITTPKHFVANIGHNGMFGGAIMYSERFLREVEFPPFKMAVDAGCGSIMPAYNTIDGIPCSSNKWLLHDVLRKEWGFKGFVGSDYGAVAQIWNLHNLAESKVDAAVIALTNGMDVEMPETVIFGSSLIEAVNSGKLSMAILDNAVRNALSAKIRIGLFENPFANPEAADTICDHANHRALALEAAKEAIVLLKNNKILPFPKNIKSVAVIGPLANEQLLGNYAPWGMKKVNILEGIRNKIGNSAKINYAKGVELNRDFLPKISKEYLHHNSNGTKLAGLKAEYFNNNLMEGSPALNRVDESIDFDWGEGVAHPFINQDNFSVRWTGFLVAPKSGTFNIGITCDDGARLFLNSELVLDNWSKGAKRSSTVSYYFQQGKEVRITLEYFDSTHDAVCKLGWDAINDLGIQEAVAVVDSSDACVIVCGALDGEGKDRADLNLSKNQEELIHRVAQTGKPFVVVLATGNVITMNNWIDEAPAILESWYSGEEGGTAVAEVLFGDYNPGGKLPITFPKTVGQVPAYYFMRPGTGTSFLEFGNEPQFPFGYGLSYTTFQFSNLMISKQKINSQDSFEIEFELKNTGTVPGDEVPQLYVVDLVGSVTPLRKMLRDFERVKLNPGQTKTIRFTISPEDLSILNKNMKWVVEPGKFEIQIGSSSEDIRLNKVFEVVEN